jgi:hypothetical protein
MIMYDICTFSSNHISNGSVVWITRLKLLRWMMSLRFAHPVDTKMVFTQCLRKKGVSQGSGLCVLICEIKQVSLKRRTL